MPTIFPRTFYATVWQRIDVSSSSANKCENNRLGEHEPSISNQKKYDVIASGTCDLMSVKVLRVQATLSGAAQLIEREIILDEKLYLADASIYFVYNNNDKSSNYAAAV